MFNVGDVVENCGTEYVIDDVDSSGSCHLYNRETRETIGGYYRPNILTLVTPAIPPTPVLTGMTQFFKDKEKSNVT